MSAVIISEARSYLDRPGLKPVQRQAAIVFLCKIAIKAKEENSRLQLFKLFFHMFRTLILSPSDRKEQIMTEVLKKDRTKSK